MKKADLDIELLPEQKTENEKTLPLPNRREALKQGLTLTASASLSTSTLLSACGGSGGSSPASQNTLVSSFALAVLPDTQFYSRYATVDEGSQFMKQYGSEPYLAQAQWIARNAKSLRIPFTIHLGDVVDQANKPSQWEVAHKAMQALEAAGQPYSILAGNHDIGGYGNIPSAYLHWFGAKRAQQNKTFKERDPSGWHEYHIFEAEDQKFMVLSLSWTAGFDDKAMQWANQVIKANPTLPVILSTHNALDIETDGITAKVDLEGEHLWNKLVKDNDQIFMTLNGHHHGAAHRTIKNNFGNPVEQMVVDYQMEYQGGNALMRLYEFDLTHNKIRVLSFSPWVPSKPVGSINNYDQAVLTASNQAFTIDIDFQKRFARFAPQFKAAAPTVAVSLVEQARKQILANFVQPKPLLMQAPRDANDYPVVPDTVAHWRFTGGIPGNAVPVGYVVQDMTGSSPISRAPLNIDGVQGAEVGDVVWSSDCHRYSAARGSIEFRNTRKMLKARGPQPQVPPRMSYFTTAPNAPANKADLKNGYTVETFVKIGKNWTADLNRWMNILTRDGERWSFDFRTSWEDPQASLLLFAISNLREVQWDACAYDGLDSKSAWSGEIMPDSWIHIAIVNDAKAHDTTMYIEGSPMLRNVQNKPG
ncbi:MAG: metallophosphoesterase, partial [Brachymonas sp.]|nr:metallophosphoesterase [Brachymonas sp.]